MKKNNSVVKDKYFEFTCRVVFFCIHQIGHTFFHVLFSFSFSGNMLNLQQHAGFLGVDMILWRKEEILGIPIGFSNNFQLFNFKSEIRNTGGEIKKQHRNFEL